jgi:hypothetical protein
MTDLNTWIEGRVPQEHAASWANSCRNVAVGPTCAVVNTVEDEGCLVDLKLMIAGSLSRKTRAQWAMHADASSVLVN